MAEEFKELVRLIDVDVTGQKSVYTAIQKIKGISFAMANAICLILKLDKKQKIGNLTDAQIKNIEETIKKSTKIPNWMLNRQKDPDTGQNIHLVSSDLKLRREFDIKLMKKIKCYKGIRHSIGLPVRGQKTKANFRKGKSVGVKRKAGMKRGKV